MFKEMVLISKIRKKNSIQESKFNKSVRFQFERFRGLFTPKTLIFSLVVLNKLQNLNIKNRKKMIKKSQKNILIFH